MENKKIAVLFPGVGYHCDKPLLYYSRKLAIQKGYEVKSINYDLSILYKDVKNNKLVVSCGEEEELFSTEVFTSNINFIGSEIKEDVFDCYAKVRYRQPDQKCKMIKKENGYSFIFENKQRAVTPGQFIVIYDEKRCYGGGIIESFS